LDTPPHCTEEGRNRLKILITIDGVMIIILLGNLIWMVFDWAFSFPPIHSHLQVHLAGFYRLYEPVHLKFWSYDLLFAAIFLTEFFLRWGLSILWKEYHRWFFYPALHFYDFLGSLPGGLRWWRLLRIGAFFSRLQKLVRIDSYLIRKFHKYRDIVMEEISDRVVVNVLTDLQTEIRTGTPVLKRIIEEVIRPRRKALTELLVAKLRLVIRDMGEIMDKELRIYIETCLRKALTGSEDIRLLERIPGAGKLISRKVENMAADIAYYTVDKIIHDLQAPENDRILHELAGKIIDGTLAETKKDLDDDMTEVIHMTLDIVKEHVNEKQWKIREMQEQAVCREAVWNPRDGNPSPWKRFLLPLRGNPGEKTGTGAPPAAS